MVIESARARLKQLLAYPWAGAAPAITELSYLGLEGTLWSLARRNADARRLLLEVRAWRTFYLAQAARWAEAGREAERTMELLPSGESPPWVALYAVLSLAQVYVFRGARPRPERGLAVLQRWLPGDATDTLQRWSFAGASTPTPSVFASWIEADRAEYLALDGQAASAVQRTAMAVAVAERCQDRGAVMRRRIDEARLLVRVGREREALARNARMPMRLNAHQEAAFSLVQAEALIRLGARGEAGNWLSYARAWIGSEGDYWRERIGSQADVLARRL